MKLSKNYTLINLNDIKQHLNIDVEFHDDNQLLSNYIKSATNDVENYIGYDVAYTYNEDYHYDFSASEIRIEETTANKTGITVTYDSTVLTGLTTQKYLNYLIVKLPDTITSTELKVNYYTGYQENIPDGILQAIKLRTGDYYDIHRSSYTNSSYKESKIWEYGLNGYKRISFNG